MSGDSPVTVTVSGSVATFIANGMSMVWPTLTMMPGCSTLAKPGELGGDGVGADRQRVQAVDARRIGDVGADEAGLRVRCGDGDARNRGVLRVGDAAGDVAGGLLGRAGTAISASAPRQARPDHSLHAVSPPILARARSRRRPSLASAVPVVTRDRSRTAKQAPDQPQPQDPSWRRRKLRQMPTRTVESVTGDIQTIGIQTIGARGYDCQNFGIWDRSLGTNDGRSSDYCSAATRRLHFRPAAAHRPAARPAAARPPRAPRLRAGPRVASATARLNRASWKSGSSASARSRSGTASSGRPCVRCSTMPRLAMTTGLSGSTREPSASACAAASNRRAAARHPRQAEVRRRRSARRRRSPR